MQLFKDNGIYRLEQTTPATTERRFLRSLVRPKGRFQNLDAG
jgi:hypothetical protein